MAAERMSAIQVSGYGDPEELISFSSSVQRPQLKGKGKILVRVLAVSLAPGDCRVMSGKTSLVQGPPSFPYVPGGDLCGVVAEVSQGEKKFKPGDRVVCTFDTAGPRNALAEYKLVNCANAALAPPSPELSAEQLCALPSSALSAMLLCEKYVRPEDRVLVLGASGGVGCHLVQMLKPKGASYVAAVSSQQELLLGLGVDRVVDYQKEKWWEIPEFCESPFDLVVDLVGTKEVWKTAASSKAVKSGYQQGRYVTTVGDTPYMTAKHWWHIFGIMYDMQAHSCWTSIARSNPKWIYHLGLEPKGNLERLLKLAETGELKPVLDSVHSFDAESVKKAFQIQKGKHAHGKVVIRVADEAK
ncbi:unnamed protein product [Effrenium voratum]|nr:unnamed protein product [Effrenium voratum]